MGSGNEEGIIGDRKRRRRERPAETVRFLGSWVIRNCVWSYGCVPGTQPTGFKKQPRKTAQNHRGKSLFGFEMHPLLGILIVRFLGRRQTWFFVTVCVPKRAANSSGFVW